MKAITIYCGQAIERGNLYDKIRIIADCKTYIIQH